MSTLNSWNDPRFLDSLAYDLLLGDMPRGQNRARIASLANGTPPYTPQEVEENGVEVNINDLTHTRMLHDARTQFANGFTKSGQFFSCVTDWGKPHQNKKYGTIMTSEIARVMKKSVSYFEGNRAKFGNLVLHGIGPSVWENADKWCNRPVGIEDVLIPANTLLGFENLPFFVIRRSFTGMELGKILGKVETGHPAYKGWSKKFLKSCLDYLDQSAIALYGATWPEVWAPEKVQERVKEQGGYYAADRVPTIDCFDIYAYVEDDKSGWVRRIILDNWGTPAQTGANTYSLSRKDSSEKVSDSDQFLFSSGNRKVAARWQEIISFQFADLSAVFPARYHSIRSLGWMLFAPCHLGMRLRCKFYESVLEALMPYFKVNSLDDMQRALKLDMVNKGFIDETIKPVPAAERWQVNAQLVELGLRDNDAIIQENARSWVSDQNYSQDRTEKTKFQVMAEMQAATSLTGAALAQAFQYATFEDQEIFRRFLKLNSSDPEVIQVRANLLRRGIPEKLLIPEAWQVEHEKTMGGGNKSMEMTIANWLMEARPLFDPEPQRVILRDAVLAVTDDPVRAELLVPENPIRVTDSVHDAQLSAGPLMQGLKVDVKTGVNHIEVIDTLLREMAAICMRIQQEQQGVGQPADLRGLQNMAVHISDHMKILGQDKNEVQRVKKYGDMLGKIMNMVKAFAQRLQEQMQKSAQAGQGAQMDPKDMAKIQATILQAQTKAKLSEQSHSQRTAQRQIQFEQQVRQKAEQHEADIAATDLEAAANIKRERELAPEPHATDE